MMSKVAKMISLYGGEIKPLGIDNETFIRGGDGSVDPIPEEDVEKYIDEHPNEDFVVVRVGRDVVDCISEMAAAEQRPYVGVDNGEAEAIAFMAHRSGDLQIEVLMQYTTLIQGGMRPGPAAYAALLSYDISVEEAYEDD